MNTTIEVTRMKIQSESMYDTSRYDGQGLYLVEDQFGGTYLVDVVGTTAVSLGVTPGNLVTRDEKQENHVSENTMLKALALVQKPELIKDLV